MTLPTQQLSKYLTKSQVMECIEISQPTYNRWTSRGVRTHKGWSTYNPPIKLKVYKLGSSPLILPKDLIKFLKELGVKKYTDKIVNIPSYMRK